ncbi:hypothetical protein SAMN04490190_1327 [Pseudomonas libanensis]|uniref:DUF3077 domain-containing protein n=1 Tax=Pseudomonas libanensis TaxID=75588 RepID=A0A0R2YII2_9PSED|nr:DUF6124 family protein [Pseudomonas libanensis]KRP48040.1 hypothetical protein TU73_03955 [Pseudomonas libanensis]SDK73405.1 hypothetical protein SAMN04490190_1327 [Pseudomonas libanensis]
MIKPTQNPPIDPTPSVLFTVKDGICTQDLLVNLSESLASAHALTSDFAFDLDGSRREGALGIAQLIEVSRLLAERVLADIER